MKLKNLLVFFFSFEGTIPIGDVSMQRAKKLHIPIVSTDWIVESLVQNKRLDIHANPQVRFKHPDHSEKSKANQLISSPTEIPPHTPKKKKAKIT